MKRLATIIGPAPSDCTKEELLARIKKERGRVERALDSYSYHPSSRKPPKTKVAKTIQQILGELGISEEEFLAAKKDLEEGKDEEKK